jgi:hypothetical protein
VLCGCCELQEGLANSFWIFELHDVLCSRSPLYCQMRQSSQRWPSGHLHSTQHNSHMVDSVLIW